MYEFGGCGRNAVLCGGTGGKPDDHDQVLDTDGDEIYENYRVAQTDYENYTIGKSLKVSIFSTFFESF